MITTRDRCVVTQFLSLEAGHFRHSFEALFASSHSKLSLSAVELSAEFDAKAYDGDEMSSKRNIQVKSPRTWNRRGFTVAPNGYFTVLKPSGWFAASRLPGGFRYLGGESRGPASASVQKRMAQDHVGIRESTLRLQTLEASAQDHRLMRPALVVLGAAAITSLLLWWIAFPNFH